MTKAILMLLWVLALCVPTPPAFAGTQVDVVDTSPAGSQVTLGRNQNFYLRLHYTSDVPVQIWASPYYQGKPARAGSNPSRVYPAGEGEALGWFFLFDPGTRVDEIRISAGNGSTRGTPVVARYPVDVIGGYAPAADGSTPDWATRLLAADQAANDAAAEKARNTPPDPREEAATLGILLGMALVMALGVLAGVWSCWAAWHWRGGWRVAAAIPCLVLGFVILRIIVDGVFDPTSHNLWPFEIVLWGSAAGAWMLIVAVLRKFTTTHKAH